MYLYKKCRYGIIFIQGVHFTKTYAHSYVIYNSKCAIITTE